MTASMILPPRMTTAEGKTRHIGIELEFAGLDCARVAAMVREAFGGTARQEDPYRYHVDDTCFGRFTVELDTRYAHARTVPAEAKGEAGGESFLSSLGLGEMEEDLERLLRETAGDIGQLWLPVEVVSPPIPLGDLADFDHLTESLRAAGAEGSREGLVYAFGLQLNPEMPDLSAETTLAYIQAYLVLSDWLRQRALIDRLRQWLPFAAPFPQHYSLTVMQEGYHPRLSGLIDDYLAANPTRNRELDLLPLFAHLDAARVRAQLPDTKINARPTLHWRLPDSRVSEPGWGVVEEWNRWVAVERLADQPERLRDFRQAYRRHYEAMLPGDWAAVVAPWAEGRE